MQVRRATMRDMMDMQECNLRCLPENYNLRYYHYHICSHPELLYVCEDVNGVICGYVLGKLDDEEDAKKKHGHITSLATLRTTRKLGVASKVMEATHTSMKEVYGAHYCSLHVRRTNAAARHLYQETLKYRTHEVDEGYYLDGEDAFHMKRYFRPTGDERVGYVNKDGTVSWGPLRDSPGMQKVLEEAGVSMAAASPTADNTTAGASEPAAAAAGEKPAGKAGKGAKGGKGGNAAAPAMTEEAMALLEEMGAKAGGKGGKGKGKKK